MALVTIGRPGGVDALFIPFTGGSFTNVQAQFVQYEVGGVDVRLDGNFTTFNGNVDSGIFWKMSTFPNPAATEGNTTTWQGLMSWELYNADRGAALLDAMSGDDIVRVQALPTDINARLEGFGGNDTLDATEGQNDRLIGGNGRDVLIGGDGQDVMTGGLGADVFVFRQQSDSVVGAADRITDFNPLAAGEFIDLSTLQGPTLHFLGVQAFTGAVGEVRVNNFGGPDAIVLVNLDHDLSPEMAIRLSHMSAGSLHAQDFHL